MYFQRIRMKMLPSSTCRRHGNCTGAPRGILGIALQTPGAPSMSTAFGMALRVPFGTAGCFRRCFYYRRWYIDPRTSDLTLAKLLNLNMNAVPIIGGGVLHDWRLLCAMNPMLLTGRLLSFTVSTHRAMVLAVPVCRAFQCRISNQCGCAPHYSFKNNSSA